jgi:hypothetical protein
MDALDEINALAEASTGFVWRLEGDDGAGATSIKVSADPQFIVNMSVWESLESLGDYVYRSVHVEYLRRRREWFEQNTEMHLALWWIPAGEIPTVEEGLRRVELIRAHGPTEQAFSLKRAFRPTGSGTGVPG